MKITRARFTLSPFTSEDTIRIGNALLTSIKNRIKQGLNVDESPAKPLKRVTHIDKGGGLAQLIPYDEQKRRKGRNPYRDLTNTGQLMASLQVVSANENGGEIACNNPVKDHQLHINNRRSRQFGISESDRKVLNEKAMELLQSKIRIVQS